MMKYKITLIFFCFLIFLFSIAAVSASDVNETVLARDNHLDVLNKDAQNDIQSVNQNYSKLSNDVAVNNDSFETKDNATINYLIKYKEKYDDIVNKSTKKDRTFKIGKYKLTLSKNDYKNFLYAKFIEKYDKSGKNITLLEEIFKISKYNFTRVYGSCVVSFVFPAYDVTKKTNKFIKQKIGTKGEYKDKKIFFKNYKKAKKFKKRSYEPNKIQFDKKLKKYYIETSILTYKDITTKKARVFIELKYSYNEYRLGTFTKYDEKFDFHSPKEVIKSHTFYKLSKNIMNLNKSKTNKII